MAPKLVIARAQDGAIVMILFPMIIVHVFLIVLANNAGLMVAEVVAEHVLQDKLVLVIISVFAFLIVLARCVVLMVVEVTVVLVPQSAQTPKSVLMVNVLVFVEPDRSALIQDVMRGFVRVSILVA